MVYPWLKYFWSESANFSQGVLNLDQMLNVGEVQHLSDKSWANAQKNEQVHKPDRVKTA